MTLTDLLLEYRSISDTLDAQFPMSDTQKRVFARITKMIEELGELAEVSLASADLQRESKKLTDVQVKIEDEFADVVGTLMMVGIALDVDIETAIKRKLAFTKQRLETEKHT